MGTLITIVVIEVEAGAKGGHFPLFTPTEILLPRRINPLWATLIALPTPRTIYLRLRHCIFASQYNLKMLYETFD